MARISVVTRILIPSVLVAAVVGAGAVDALGGQSGGPMWATVNVCNGPSSPNQVGVRASVPGNGTSQRMRVRFTAEWLSRRQNAWLPVDGASASPWVDAGSARNMSGQAGWTFAIDPPPAGATFTVRGVAELQWLEGGTVVRSATQVAQGGIAGVDYGDPVGTSLASCELRGAPQQVGAVREQPGVVGDYTVHAQGP